jgi:hypothetical protein
MYYLVKIISLLASLRLSKVFLLVKRYMSVTLYYIIISLQLLKHFIYSGRISATGMYRLVRNHKFFFCLQCFNMFLTESVTDFAVWFS